MDVMPLKGKDQGLSHHCLNPSWLRDILQTNTLEIYRMQGHEENKYDYARLLTKCPAGGKGNNSFSVLWFSQ